MKAKDITPGEYEAKDYRGTHKVLVDRIIKVEETVRTDGRDMIGHKATNTYVVTNSGSRYTLQQIVRPWAEAAPEHEAAAAVQAKAERIRSRLESILIELGVDTEVWDDFTLRLTQEGAIRLTDLLRVAGEGRAL